MSAFFSDRATYHTVASLGGFLVSVSMVSDITLTRTSTGRLEVEVTSALTCVACALMRVGDRKSARSARSRAATQRRPVWL